MCKRLTLIYGALGAFASLGVQAEIPLAYHLSGQAVYTKIKASGESFSPTLFQLKAEAAFTEGMLDGIGIQGLVATSMGEDKANTMSMDVKQQSAAYITLTDPDTQPEDLRVSILLGYASTELEYLLPRLGSEGVKDTFSDFSYGVSVLDRIIEDKPIYWTLDYIRYYKDDNLRIDGVSLGVTYAF